MQYIQVCCYILRCKTTCLYEIDTTDRGGGGEGGSCTKPKAKEPCIRTPYDREEMEEELMEASQKDFFFSPSM